MRPAGLRGPHILPTAMFFGTFAWSFVYVSLPFHIYEITTMDALATLRWTGWILGITPLTTVLTGPLWGRWAGRGDPQAFYVRVELLQGIAFFGMALARTLPELFFSRLVLGVVGSASTFAFIIAGREAEGPEVRRRVAAVQSAMTVGQVIGPLAGAIAAARLGFRPSFMLGGTILLVCAAMVWWGTPPSPYVADARHARRPARLSEVLRVSLVILGASTQIFFLAAILPQILPPLGVPPAQTLEIGGIIIFASGVAAAVGALAAPRVAEVVPERRLILGLLVAASGFQALLAFAGSVWSYGVIRFFQVLCIAPVFPIVVARIAQHAGGEAIGIINSARIGAAFVGPVVATSVLAWGSAAVLYLVLAVAGLACVPLVAGRDSGRTPA